MGGLTRKLFVGFGAVIGVLFLVAALLIGLLTIHGATLQQVLRDNYDSVTFCDRMKDALDQAQSIVQSHLLSNAPFDQTTLAAAQKTFEQNAQSEIQNSTLPGELEKARAILSSGQTCFAAISQPNQNNFFPQYQSARQLISTVSQMNLDNLAAVNRQVRDSLLVIRNTVVSLLIAGLVLTVLFVVATARNMIKPLMELTASVRQIEAGNLDLMVHVPADDEIGLLAVAFNAMAEKLREYRRLDTLRLQRTQQTTQSAIDSLPDAVIILDPTGIIEIANATAQLHFKITPGANIRDIRPDWAESYFRPVIASRQPVLPDGYRSAIQLFDNSGERFLLPRSIPMIDAQGTLIGVTLVLVEVTHLRRADEFKSGLISTASHELKTPLTSIRLAVNLLLNQRLGPLTTQQQTLLEAARIDSERLVRTLDDILTIGRVEAGRAKLDLASIPASDVVTRAIAAVDSAASSKKITIEKNFPNGDPLLDADLNLLACALSNLLSNAIKYSPESSAITITVSRVESLIEFAVADHGPGIPDEFRDHIFDKFFRIPTPAGPTGAGLGLAIAKDIIQLHNGSIALNSTPTGATFLLRLTAKHP